MPEDASCPREPRGPTFDWQQDVRQELLGSRRLGIGEIDLDRGQTASLTEIALPPLSPSPMRQRADGRSPGTVLVTKPAASSVTQNRTGAARSCRAADPAAHQGWAPTRRAGRDSCAPAASMPWGKRMASRSGMVQKHRSKTHRVVGFQRAAIHASAEPRIARGE